MQSILRIVVAGLLAGSAIAQSNAQLPTCAQGCISADYGGCEATDIECICTQGDWIANLACCVSTSCDATGQEQTIQFANAICGSAGAADALPTTATCAATATSTAPSTSSTSSGTATSAVTATTSAPSTVTSAAATTSAPATTAGDSGANACKAQGAGLVLGFIGFLAAL